MALPNITRRGIFSLLSGASVPTVLPLSRTDVQATSSALAMTELRVKLYPRTKAEFAAKVTPTNYNYQPGNVLRYGVNAIPGTTDVSTAFQAAFDQQAQGGAAVYAPTGTYFISSVVSTPNAAPFVFHGDGMGKTVIIKGLDEDCFVVSNLANALNLVAISDLTICPGVAMKAGAALNITCSEAIPSVTFRNVMILCSGTRGFGYGIKLHNCGEVEMSRVFVYGINPDSMIAIAVTQSVPSTVYKFTCCSIYNVACGFAFTNATRPGIEGIQFYGCDIVGVQCGVRYTNLFGPGYFPPQLTWIGGHINATIRSFDLSIVCQIFIQGLLSYNSGNSQHIKLDNVSDINIQGNTFVQIGGTADGITMSAGGTLFGGMVARNMFQMGASGIAVNLDATNIRNLSICDNHRVSGSTTVSVSAGTLDGTVLISNNTPRDAVDIVDTTLTGAARMTLTGIRSDYCFIQGPRNATTCCVLTSRRAWDRVTLECSSHLLTLWSSPLLDRTQSLR